MPSDSAQYHMRVRRLWCFQDNERFPRYVIIDSKKAGAKARARRRPIRGIDFLNPQSAATRLLSDLQVQKFWEIRITGYEDADYDSDNGVAAHGVRPDSGAATDADADERNADYGASEREEDTRAGAEQTSGKT